MPNWTCSHALMAGVLGMVFLLPGCGGTAPSIDGVSKVLSPVGEGVPAASAGGLAPENSQALTTTPVAPPQPTVAAELSPQRSASPANGDTKIVAFRGKSIVLYSTETGNDGERITASSFALPMSVRAPSTTSQRLQVMTVYGPRWIARADVSLSQSEDQLPQALPAVN